MSAFTFPTTERPAPESCRLVGISEQEIAFFKGVKPLPITPGNRRHGGLASDPIRPPFDQGIPEGGAAHGKADEARNGCRRRQPRADPLVVRSAAEDDATHPVAAIPPRG